MLLGFVSIYANFSCLSISALSGFTRLDATVTWSFVPAVSLLCLVFGAFVRVPVSLLPFDVSSSASVGWVGLLGLGCYALVIPFRLSPFLFCSVFLLLLFFPRLRFGVLVPELGFCQALAVALLHLCGKKAGGVFV